MPLATAINLPALKVRVDQRMRELGKTYTDVAASMGNSSSLLSDLLMGRRGQRTLSAKLPLLAAALDWTEEEMLTGLDTEHGEP